MVDTAYLPRGSHPSTYAFFSWWVFDSSHVLSMGLEKAHGAFRYMLNNSILIGLERHYLAYDVDHRYSVYYRPTVMDKSHTIQSCQS